jgi:beta-glucosidase/6-phospho-beta-glucosidase/beta-galactosidase
MSAGSVEIWGGVECTYRRVGDAYSDQLVRNGHRDRLDDLDRFADLGLRTLRYPVLWETVAPDSLDHPDWQWPDERLGRLQELGIEPIVGLVHHGSGPRYTALDQPTFAPGLARYARMVAERYPWVKYYTPVNEPLTTARFSGLYGLWYPHGRHDTTFVRILINELQATRLAMLAIREVNPAAQLVQTEDLGQAHGTPGMAEQVEFENHRRWATFDILCGRVTPSHPLWSYFCTNGIEEVELQEFIDSPLPPDVLGINNYVTSERYLDERLELYPGLPAISGRCHEAYIDTEAVRVLGVEVTGLENLLRETWERYAIPLAITEAHLGCTREEQLRWLHQTWSAANRLLAEGIDLRGLTVWSLLGAFDWDSLLALDEGHYEPGVFDVRDNEPRPTALYHMVHSLIRDGHYTHPVLAGLGWWQRELRFSWPAEAA